LIANRCALALAAVASCNMPCNGSRVLASPTRVYLYGVGDAMVTMCEWNVVGARVPGRSDALATLVGRRCDDRCCTRRTGRGPDGTINEARGLRSRKMI
jgi:hypothetical protein